MSGRLCFSVASLSWVERTLASTLYGSPPEATMDEAIESFLKVGFFVINSFFDFDGVRVGNIIRIPYRL